MNTDEKFATLVFKINEMYHNAIFMDADSDIEQQLINKGLVMSDEDIRIIANEKTDRNTVNSSLIEKEGYTFSIKTITRIGLLNFDDPKSLTDEVIETVIAIRKGSDVLTFTFITDTDKDNALKNQNKALEFINLNSIDYIFNYIEKAYFK